MISYKDEKLYGSTSTYSNLSDKELAEKIRELEIKIYGHTIEEPSCSPAPQIYDVKKANFK